MKLKTSSWKRDKIDKSLARLMNKKKDKGPRQIKSEGKKRN